MSFRRQARRGRGARAPAWNLLAGCTPAAHAALTAAAGHGERGLPRQHHHRHRQSDHQRHAHHRRIAHGRRGEPHRARWTGRGDHHADERLLRNFEVKSSSSDSFLTMMRRHSLARRRKFALGANTQHRRHSTRRESQDDRALPVQPVPSRDPQRRPQVHVTAADGQGARLAGGIRVGMTPNIDRRRNAHAVAR